MPTRKIMDRLKAGEVLLMDGGTGSEIQRRGADVLVGSTVESDLKAWSATANVDFADVVQQVHQDYLRVGADVLISNNFWTTPTRMERIGKRGEWQKYARASGENALKARDALNSEAYVTGGIAAPTLGRMSDGKSDIQFQGEETYRGEFADHARLLADVGVDVMLPEYVGHVDDCVAAVDACAEAGLPVWLGVRHIRQDGTMQYGDSFADLASALKGHPVDSILIMCTRPEASTAGLAPMRDAFDIPVGIYANVGYNPMAPLGGRPRVGADILPSNTESPSRMADYAGQWKEMGAQIIGGCCATGPEHIMAMRPVVKEE